MDLSSEATNDQQGEQQQGDASGSAPPTPASDTPAPASPASPPDTSSGGTSGPQPEPKPATPPASAQTPGAAGASPTPSAQSNSAPAPPAGKNTARDAARLREYHAQQVELFARTAPDTPGHYVRLAAYFGTAPQVVAFDPEAFKLAFETKRYQDSLRRPHLGENPIPTLDEMAAGPVRNRTAEPSVVQPKQGGLATSSAQNSSAGFDGKARNADEAQLFKSLGISALAKRFGVPRAEVAAMPGLYWMRYATEPEDVLPHGAPPSAGPGSPIAPGADPFTVGEDPLSGDSGLKKIILQNRDLFTNKPPAGQEQGGSAAYPNFSDNIPGGKGRTSVFIFDSGTRPPDKGVHGTTYGGVAYAVSTDGLGGITVRGPYRASTYANSKSNTDNTPAYAEIKGKTLSEGGEAYVNTFGHNPPKGEAKRGLNMGHYEPDGNGRMKFDKIVEATGPNPANHDQPIVKDGNVHPGYSDNGGYMSRGSKACFVLHPDDAPSFFNHNFEWNKDKPTTGTSRGFVYTYRGDSQEASALRSWLESQRPTK